MHMMWALLQPLLVDRDEHRRSNRPVFFLPSSMECNESSEGLQPKLFNVPKECRWLGPQAICVDEWEAQHIHTVAHRHDSFNPMKCVRRSRL
jgi:hypothetical protein